MNLRRVCLAAAGPVLLLSIAACGGTGNADAEGTAGGPASDAVSQVKADPAAVKLLPAALKERGTLTMAADLHYPPTSFLDTDNKTPIGYNVDIATLLANTLG